MTAEEAAEAYGKAVLEALNETAAKIPATALLSICLGLQEKLEGLTQSEPTARATTRLVTSLGRLARLANEAIVEHGRKTQAELDQRLAEIGKPKSSS